jgi:heme O synthase-like polyprenyltransferase
MTLHLSAFRTRATSLFRDYAELTKLRVTSLIVMTAGSSPLVKRGTDPSSRFLEILRLKISISPILFAAGNLAALSAPSTLRLKWIASSATRQL